MRRNLLFLSMCAVVGLSACAGMLHETPEEAHLQGENCAQCHPANCPRSQPTLIREVSYSKDIQPIFDMYCVNCHGPDRQAGGLSLASRDEFMQMGIIEAGSYDDSKFRRKLMGGDLPMAHRGVTDLTTEQIKMVKRWINEGAKDN